MADRKAGLDVDHCRAAMRELGLLHALSLAMKLCRPQEFATSVVASVQEALFVPENEDWYRGYYRAATRNALTMVSMHYMYSPALIVAWCCPEPVETSSHPRILSSTDILTLTPPPPPPCTLASAKWSLPIRFSVHKQLGQQTTFNTIFLY
jgi:hypothetical protein